MKDCRKSSVVPDGNAITEAEEMPDGHGLHVEGGVFLCRMICRGFTGVSGVEVKSR